TLAGEMNPFRDDNGYLVVNATHCEFWGGSASGYIFSVNLTNCLLGRFVGGAYGGRDWLNYSLRNCTMRAGRLWFDRGDGGVTKVSIKDTAFDATTLDTYDSYADD